MSREDAAVAAAVSEPEVLDLKRDVPRDQFIVVHSPVLISDILEAMNATEVGVVVCFGRRLPMAVRRGQVQSSENVDKGFNKDVIHIKRPMTQERFNCLIEEVIAPALRVHPVFFVGTGLSVLNKVWMSFILQLVSTPPEKRPDITVLLETPLHLLSEVPPALFNHIDSILWPVESGDRPEYESMFMKDAKAIMTHLSDWVPSQAVLRQKCYPKHKNISRTLLLTSKGRGVKDEAKWIKTVKCMDHEIPVWDGSCVTVWDGSCLIKTFKQKSNE